ncbi:MAG: short-chain dehydrogenase [Bacteroidetes bacterium 4572_112]|nr:MAG: short-chain dehydrogenase [Bacteroidetes bacterium 4572_112]
MKSIKNTVWWITGASSGIGKGIALFVLKNGGKVILSSRNEDKLKEVVKAANAIDNNYLILPLDLEKMDNTHNFIAEVLQKFNRIDFLINNGGISQRSLVSETSIDIDRRIMETNFFGTVALTKAVLPIMIKQQSGHICAVSSVVGKFGFPLRSAYSASKQALHGFFESLRAENVSNNIKVSMIIPGRINTSISNNALTKDGTKHGILDEGQANSMGVERASEIIIKGILKEKKEILVGGKELIMVHIRRWLPRLFYFMANRVSAT